MNGVTAGLALAMSVALEGAESDLERAARLLEQPHQRDECLKAAIQLLGRAKLRLQTVRVPLAEAGAAALTPMS